MYNKNDVLEYITSEDVKFIKLAFCDIFGVQKNIAIIASELERAFEYGISFDASAIQGFGDEASSSRVHHLLHQKRCHRVILLLAVGAEDIDGAVKVNPHQEVQYRAEPLFLSFVTLFR